MVSRRRYGIIAIAGGTTIFDDEVSIEENKMTEYRIMEHPILPIEPRKAVAFYWQGQKLLAQEEETIASALFANGIRVFSYHPKDNAPQGIFCANGQCAQCLVMANGRPWRVFHTA